MWVYTKVYSGGRITRPNELVTCRHLSLSEALHRHKVPPLAALSLMAMLANTFLLGKYTAIECI